MEGGWDQSADRHWSLSGRIPQPCPIRQPARRRNNGWTNFRRLGRHRKHSL